VKIGPNTRRFPLVSEEALFSPLLARAAESRSRRRDSIVL
jgi:hypothetical protein